MVLHGQQHDQVLLSHGKPQADFLSAPKMRVHAAGFLSVEPMEEPLHLSSYFYRAFQKYITFLSSCLSKRIRIGQLFKR